MAPVDGLSVNELRALVMAQQQTIVQLSGTIETLPAEVRELKRLLFGSRSERLKREAMPPLARALRARRSDERTDAAAAQQKRAARAARRAQLPMETMVCPLERCPHCQSEDLQDLRSPEVSDEIELVPAHFVRRRYVRAKAKCPRCARVVTAPASKRVTDGGLWGPTLHAHAVVAMCADALPFYRLANRFQRDGLPMERSTLNRLFHRSAELLRPIAARILQQVVASERINADETPLFVQAPERCRRGFLWVFLAGRCIAYVFSPTRSGHTPRRLLRGTKGILQVDDYSGYNAVCVPEGRQRLGCLAHVRRKFFRALDSAPDEAQVALDLILSLYDVEYDAAQKGILGSAEHLTLRRSTTEPRLQTLTAWLEQNQSRSPPKSPLGQALRYALKTVPTLRAVLDDATLRLDNNVAENALRLIALGRKNFLFVGDDEGGENLATLQTVVSTCLANDVNPERYIADVLLRLDETPRSQIDSLLPMNWQPRTAASAPLSA